MRTGLIPGHRVVEGAGQAITLTMTSARVRRTRRVVKHGTGNARERRMGRRKGR